LILLEKNNPTGRRVLGNNAEVVAFLELNNRPKLIKELVAFMGDNKNITLLAELIHQV